MENKNVKRIILAVWLLLTVVLSAGAEDIPESRATLRGLAGVAVFVEEPQTNIQKYAQKAGLERNQLQQEVERYLQSHGIAVLSYDQWLRTPGMPFFYLNINTHETERYWYAYDIKVEVRQTAILEVNPKLRTVVATWSTNMTGLTNIGNLSLIKKDVMVMVHKFVAAYQATNKGK